MKPQDKRLPLENPAAGERNDDGVEIVVWNLRRLTSARGNRAEAVGVAVGASDFELPDGDGVGIVDGDRDAGR